MEYHIFVLNIHVYFLHVVSFSKEHFLTSEKMIQNISKNYLINFKFLETNGTMIKYKCYLDFHCVIST